MQQQHLLAKKRRGGINQSEELAFFMLGSTEGTGQLLQALRDM